jgi:hypothetical protein
VKRQTMMQRDANEKPIVKITKGIIIAIGITKRKSSQGSSARSNHLYRLIRIPNETPKTLERTKPITND